MTISNDSGKLPDTQSFKAEIPADIARETISKKATETISPKENKRTLITCQISDLVSSALTSHILFNDS